MPVRFSSTDILYISLGGMLGSLLRWWIGLGFEGAFPAPTILVNILGACAIGVLYASRHKLDPGGKYLYIVGFCRSFTTVSLFCHETILLLESGNWLGALLNLGLPVIASLLVVGLLVGPIERAVERGRE